MSPKHIAELFKWRVFNVLAVVWSSANYPLSVHASHPADKLVHLIAQYQLLLRVVKLAPRPALKCVHFCHSDPFYTDPCVCNTDNIAVPTEPTIMHHETAHSIGRKGCSGSQHDKSTPQLTSSAPIPVAAPIIYKRTPRAHAHIHTHLELQTDQWALKDRERTVHEIQNSYVKPGQEGSVPKYVFHHAEMWVPVLA